MLVPSTTSIAVGFGSGPALGCLRGYGVTRLASGAGFSNVPVGPDGGFFDPSALRSRGHAALYINGFGAGGNQVEALGWDSAACALLDPPGGIVAVADVGRFLSVGALPGLVVSAGYVFNASGALVASAVTGVQGTAFPPPAAPAAAASAPAPSVAGPVVGSLFGDQTVAKT